MEKIFKARRLDNGEWVEFELKNVFFNHEAMPIADSLYFLDKDTICQYTGINDKEGNRIFEGDEVYVAGVGNVTVSVDVNGVHFGDEPYVYLYEDIEELTGHNIHDKD